MVRVLQATVSPCLPFPCLSSMQERITGGTPRKVRNRDDQELSCGKAHVQLRGIRFLLAFAASDEGRLAIGFYICICHLSISYLFLLSCESCSVVSDSLQPHGILQARILEWIAFPSPGYLSIPGIEPRSPTLQGDSLLSEPPGKPKNTRVNCHFLLQENLSVQGSNTCLLISRQILYY